LFSKAPTVALIDSVIPVDDRVLRAARDVALIVGASLFVALMAQLVIHLPFTPVPITGQTLAVLLTGAALGSWRGGAALLLYLVEGSFLPFYAGGASGLVWTFASGGYIIGFIPAAFVVGFLSERGWDRSVWIILAMLAGNIILYVPGLIQLSYFVPEGKALEFGLYPFILGDLVKLYIASLALPTAWAVVNRFQPPSNR
jgi:biotin transporter BioY